MREETATPERLRWLPCAKRSGGCPCGPNVPSRAYRRNIWPHAVVSPNLTPDPVTGRPDGDHSFEQFLTLIRHGRDLEDGHILQVMPWLIFRNMNDNDLASIYEYLRAIPHAEPGMCVAPGQ